MVGNGMGTAAEILIGATWAPYRAFVGGLIAVQEQNMKLARRSAGVFLEGTEKQREALQAVAEESFKVYAGFLYAPTSPRNGSGTNGSSPDLPVEDYDQLSVGEVTGRLEELSAGEVEELKVYEKKNQNRDILVERFDRSLV